MDNSKKYTNIILSIILVCSIIFTALSGFVRFSLSDKDTYLTLLEKSNTYSNVEQALYKKMSSVLGDEVGEELKKSIITEDDVRNEAEVVLDIMLQNLKSGQAIIPEIDASIYKKRIAHALESLTGYDMIADKEKSMTSNIQVDDIYFEPVNAIKSKNDFTEKNMLQTNKLNKSNNDEIYAVNIATRAELEAQGRALIKQKGMTEAEARQKAAERGITEADVWNYLEQNGYLDDESDTQVNTEESDSFLNVQEYTEQPNSFRIIDNNTEADGTSDQIKSDNTGGNVTESTENRVYKKKIQQIITSVIMDNGKSFDEKLQAISLKLMDEAEKIINVEMEKLNFSKIISSEKFKIAAKIASVLYKGFYGFLLVSLFICICVIIVNKNDLANSVDIIAKSLIAAGVIMSFIFGYTYLSELYTDIDINFNKAYFESMFLESAQYFSKLLFISSVIITLLGLLMDMFMMKKRFTRR